MADPVADVPGLGRFIYDTVWTPLRGTYIFPLKYFSNERSTDPNEYLEVVRIVDVDSVDVAVTRGGGLFVRTDDISRTEEHVDRLASLLNLLLCQFAFAGLVSHPVTDIDIQDAQLIGAHVSITGGWGSHGERTWGPFSLLASTPRNMAIDYAAAPNEYWPVNFYWTVHDPTILDQIDPPVEALRLRRLGTSLPPLLLAAAYHSSRHSIAETIVSAWILCEALLGATWDRYVGAIGELPRRRRLKDFRVYTASVQLEVLFTAGIIPAELYMSLHRARKIRNDLAHGAQMSHVGASDTFQAMLGSLQYWEIPTDRIPGFSFQSGGGRAPTEMAEPAFPLRRIDNG
jgi:hypothetical protein